MVNKFFGNFQDIPNVLFVFAMVLISMAILSRTPMLSRIVYPNNG